jgi:hypothetical protein
MQRKQNHQPPPHSAASASPLPVHAAAADATTASRLFPTPYPGFFPAFPGTGSNFGIFGWIPAPGLSLIAPPSTNTSPFRTQNQQQDDSPRSELLTAWNARHASSPPSSPMSAAGS